MVREMGTGRRHILRRPKTTGEEKGEGRIAFEVVHTGTEGKSGESTEWDRTDKLYDTRKEDRKPKPKRTRKRGQKVEGKRKDESVQKKTTKGEGVESVLLRRVGGVLNTV